jgi:hypothetical protein
MHFYRTFQAILASKEAMWEDLQLRRVGKTDLEELGWEEDPNADGEDQLGAARQRFDSLLETFAT